MSGVKELRPLNDLEQLARLIVNEAGASFSKAVRILFKISAVSAIGLFLVQSFSEYFVPMGVIVLAVVASWLDVIREECLQQRFFPSKRLNAAASVVLHWHCLMAVACLLVSFPMTVSGTIDWPNLLQRCWSLLKCAALPTTLMLIGRKVEPFGFRHARSDVREADQLLRQLVLAKDGTQMETVVEPDCLPVYSLSSVAALLRNAAKDYGTDAKMAVELQMSKNVVRATPSALASVYAPFRSIANDVFLWETRDTVLYSVVIIYLALTYLGSFYFPLAPICVLVPFLGPKSRVARYVRGLQEDIRVVQGCSVEKKGGMKPQDPEDVWLTINWPMLGYVATVHSFALYAIIVIVFFQGCCPLSGSGKFVKKETYCLAMVLYFFSALGITGGVHRHWAHKSYKAGLPLKFFLMVMNSIANQGCIFHWARDHRVHHLYSDTVADPHDANRGFWFSHVGWLIFKKHPAVIAAGKTLNLNDLLSDPVVMFQKRADPFWNLMWCYGFPAFMALHWGDTLWNGFLVAGVLRYVLLLNATWAVNSVVHCWGTKPYNPAHKTTEVGWVSLFAIGEGWHNWHHAFDWDYAAAELGALQQFNPTKVFIDIMLMLGLAWDAKRAHKVWETRKARWAEQCGRPVEESIEGPFLFRKRVVHFGPVLHDDDEQ